MSRPRKPKVAPLPAGTASRETGGPYLAGESVVALLAMSRENPSLFFIVICKLLSPALVAEAERQLGLAVADRLRQLINSESPVLLPSRKSNEKEPPCQSTMH